MGLDLLSAILLAIIQGITEWLPISSSGHLVLAQMLFGLKVPILFDIMLHLGTLLAALFYFRDDIRRMAFAFFSFNSKSEDSKLVWLILLAGIPTAAIGFAFKDFFESQFSSGLGIGIAMAITGTFLFICEGTPGSKRIGAKSAFVIGVAQGLAVMPGISRSGSTIGAGLLMGVEREKALRFSFILGIPAILGAALFEWDGAEISGIPLETSLIAIAISAIVGYLSIGFMMDFVKRRGLKPFSYYCFLIGMAAIAASLAGAL